MQRLEDTQDLQEKEIHANSQLWKILSTVIYVSVWEILWARARVEREVIYVERESDIIRNIFHIHAIYLRIYILFYLYI